MFSSLLIGLSLLVCAVLGSVFKHTDHHAPLKKLALRHEGNAHLNSHLIHALALNRAHRRRALMAGHPPPSDASLRQALRKRQLAVEESVNRRQMLKRRGRVGHAGSNLDFGEEDSLLQVTWKAVGPPLNEAAKAKSSPSPSVVAASGTATAANAQGFPSPDAAVVSGNPVTPAKTPTAANSVGENIEGRDSGYFASFGVGTPPAQFNLLLDSGSSDLWMPGVDCEGCNHPTLGTNSSSTFKASTTPWSIKFGTGEVAGTLCEDTVNVAGLTLAGHKFGVTDQETIDFTDPTIPFDGLMGVAKSQLSNQNNTAVPEALAQANLATAQMGFKLGRVSDGDNDGQATFGGVDATKFVGDLVEMDNVSPLGFFEVAMDGATVNGADLGLSGRTAILDTGTTLLVIPQEDATAIHAAIPGSATDGQGNFGVPCTSQAVVALQMGGQSYTINPSDMAFVTVDPSQPTGLCISGISSGQIGGPEQWLVGDTFLKNVYLATDATANKVGLARLPNSFPDVGGAADATNSSANTGALASAAQGGGKGATETAGAATTPTSVATADPKQAGKGTIIALALTTFVLLYLL